MGKRNKSADGASEYLEMAVAAPRRGFIRRHRAPFIAFVSLIGVIAIVIIATVFAINRSIGNIAKIPITIPEGSRPIADSGKALNILILGADAGTARNGAGTSILKDAASSSWPTGKYRSDATMFVHISADRKYAYVISIPRDSYVKVYDSTGTARDDTKINAALSLYGPSGAISTVEHFTGLRVDHLAMIDWDGFQSITDSLGGVSLTVPGKGKVDMNGSAALTYVRERHNLPHGDFDRVKRQQNFLRAILMKMASTGTLVNPLKLARTVSSVSQNVAVDDNWSTGDIRSFAIDMRNIRPSNVHFLTLPTTGTATDPIAGSIVTVDKVRDAALFQSIRVNTIAKFVSGNPKWSLGSAETVN